MPDFSSRTRQTELLDAGGVPLEEVRRSLSDMRRINRIFQSRRILLETLAAEVTRRNLSHFKFLDVASGSCDLPLAVLDWAASRGIPAQAFAMEYQHSHFALFRAELARQPALHLFCADALRAAVVEKSLDFVTCCNFFHHLSESQAVELLAAMMRWARHAVIVSDLERHWFPYYFFRLVSPFVSTTRVTRTDGCLSIAQSYRKPELEQIARAVPLPNFTVERRWPFRLLLVGNVRK